MNLSGSRLMAASRLSTLSAATAGLTTSTLGWAARMVMGAMSFSVSYGIFANNSALMTSGPPRLMPMV